MPTVAQPLPVENIVDSLIYTPDNLRTLLPVISAERVFLGTDFHSTWALQTRWPA
jgi:hypothetical protein